MNHVQLSGRFKIDSLINGIITPKVPWQDNVILLSGLDRLNSGGITLCAVGSGTTEPVKEDVALEIPVATAPATAQPTVPYTETPWGSYTPFLATFTPPGAEHTISELGLGWNGGMFSRALLKNMLGGVQAIPWAADETLLVTYFIILRPILTDFTYNITLLQVPYTITTRACHVDDSRYWRFYNGAQEFQKLGDGTAAASKVYFGAYGIGTNLLEPTGVAVFDLAFTPMGYVTGSHCQIGKFVANINAYHAAGISAFMITSTIGTIQYKMDPPFIKYSDDILEILATTPVWNTTP